MYGHIPLGFVMVQQGRLDLHCPPNRSLKKLLDYEEEAALDLDLDFGWVRVHRF